VLDQRSVVAMLKAVAEPTRLRLLVLLAEGELNVKDLTRILGQSQPRISRHLKLMAEAGLIERIADGSWAYFQVVDHGAATALVRGLLDAINPADPAFDRDRKRADTVKREREQAAQAYFRDHAAEWDRIRALHVDEADVEAALKTAVGPGPYHLLVDLGTGTGRMLELFAERAERAVGFDINHSMLAYARGRLERAGLSSVVALRHGDLYEVAQADNSADVVIIHQVLHFLADPQPALREAARILAPGGRLVIVDFAPHKMEFLREQHAHERLGFSSEQLTEWLVGEGLGNVAAKSLAPAGDLSDSKLTVIVCTATKPGTPARAATTSRPKKRVEA
jgi:ubiquinone/menaquinone biosynthesis C-methylase UbiE